MLSGGDNGGGPGWYVSGVCRMLYGHSKLLEEHLSLKTALWIVNVVRNEAPVKETNNINIFAPSM